MANKDLRKALEETAALAGADTMQRLDPRWVKLSVKDNIDVPFTGKLLLSQTQRVGAGERLVHIFELPDGERVRVPGQTNLDSVLVTCHTGQWLVVVYKGEELCKGGSQRIGRWEVYAAKLSVDGEPGATEPGAVA